MIKLKVSIDYFDFVFDDAHEAVKFALMALQHDSGNHFGNKEKRSVSIFFFETDDEDTEKTEDPEDEI